MTSFHHNKWYKQLFITVLEARTMKQNPLYTFSLHVGT